MKIEEEIAQPVFPNEFHRAHVNLLFTASFLGLQVTHWLKPFKISMQQFNLLRILRGSNPKPASVRELTEKMLDKASNASRLVDKLLLKELVRKSASPDDQRQVEVYITENGLKVLEESSEIVEQSILNVFATLTESEALQLNFLLDKLRG